MREGYISRGFGAGAGGRDGDGRRDHRSHPPEGPRDQPLRGSVNRRVANVTMAELKATQSFGELPSRKSCQPIDGSS
jgi:hypothetical protein